MNERAERIGRNEILFRQVNERLEEMNEAFAVVTDVVEFVCECGEPACVEQITLTVPEYERVRADPATFALVPGHEAPDVETVVEENDRFAIVRKHEGFPAKLAAEHDPRQPS